MNVAFPSAKGGVSKTRSIMFDPLRGGDFLRTARLSARLHAAEGDSATYNRVIAEMTARYGLTMDTILSLGEAAGKCSTALALLDEGFPPEYILAMGASGGV